MSEVSVFFAFPDKPPRVGETIETAARNGVERTSVETWEETDIIGRFIGFEVLNKIDAHLCMGADVTYLNFNVTYEVGYAIGRRRRLILTRNRSLEDDAHLRTDLGIFDTLGYSDYENSEELRSVLEGVKDSTPLTFDDSEINAQAPVYLLEPKFKTDQATRMIARVKKARLFYRSFDPNEQPRLSAYDAITNVAQSAGVVLLLARLEDADAQLNNLRVAFLAGLARGMSKITTILQDGDAPVPIDYRDLVVPFTHPDQIDEAIESFAVRTVEAMQTGSIAKVKEPESFLASLSLGASSAENEFKTLGQYYIQTDAYLRVTRGEARLVVGRKGAGKTALFSQLRDRTRAQRQNIVIDLKPDGYKLRKFSELIGGLLSKGTFEHTVMALWEYLLLLEICYKLLEKDELPHTRNQRLFKPYRELAEAYESDTYISEGDFSERMTVLLDRIEQDYMAAHGEAQDLMLTGGQVTNLVFSHDLPELRNQLTSYMSLKGDLWILIDNLDKGWPTHGIAEVDLIILRSLMEATRKLQRDFQKTDQECNVVVFIRNDVFDLLIEETPDRGKESKVVLDWTDPALLRELLRRRLVFNGLPKDSTFEEIWPQVCVSHFEGEESSQYLIDRSLMRPRGLINLVEQCRGHAVNLQRSQIGRDDIEEGFKTFSTDLLTDIGFEIRDVFPEADEILYVFLGAPSKMSGTDYELLLIEANVDPKSIPALTEILIWYGFLGIGTDTSEPKYIYSVNYDIKRLKAFSNRAGQAGLQYFVNEAFWPALEIVSA